MTHQTVLHLADGTKVVVAGGSLEAKPKEVVIAHKGATVKGAKGAIVIALPGSNVTSIDETYLVALAGATVDGDLLDDLAFNPIKLDSAKRDFDPEVACDPAALVVLYDGETFIAAFAGRAEVRQGRIGIALRGGSVKALPGSTAIVLPNGSAETEMGATLVALPGAYVNSTRVDSFTLSTPE